MFEPRTVKIGRRLGESVQILDGLKDGERVNLAFTPGASMAMLKTVEIAPARSEKHSSNRTSSPGNHKAGT